MSSAVAEKTGNLGFLCILKDGTSTIGGYLATNSWGRPLEFRLTSAVQPNRVQQILYANTLDRYICAELIGKTLIEKTPVPVDLVLTDTKIALDMRRHVALPMAWIARAEKADEESSSANVIDDTVSTVPVRDIVHCHAEFSDDAPVIQELLNSVIGGLDLVEPFQRVREAATEARRVGVGKKR